MVISPEARGGRFSAKLESDLYDQIADLWIVDSHEHLVPESDRTAMEVDVVSLFENYAMWDLRAAGMSDAEFLAMIDRDQPPEARWRILRGYLPLIQNTSFSRSILLSVRELYGIDCIADETYRELSDRMWAANQPGIYCRVFRDRARILAALNQSMPGLRRPLPEVGSFRIPEMWETQFSVAFGLQPLREMENALQCSISSLEAYEVGLADWLEDRHRQGVVGVKLDKPVIQSLPQKSDVVQVFDNLLRAQTESLTQGEAPAAHSYFLSVLRGEQPPLDGSYDGGLPLTLKEKLLLRDYLAHTIIRIAGDLGLVIIQHCGNRGPWEDYRTSHPADLIPVFRHYPHVRFELYHAGMPWVREAGMIAKAFPNVWLNLCWSHSQCSQMARSALGEWLDLLPANKIIAFGGDTFLSVEWTLGDPPST